MRKKVFYIITVSIEVLVVLILAALILVALLLLWLPYYKAQSVFPGGEKLYLEILPEGGLHIQWPVAAGADRYRFEIYDPLAVAASDGEAGPPPLVSREFVQPECVLDDPAQGNGRLIRITALADYKILGREKVRESRGGLSVTLPEHVPAVSGFTVEIREGGTAVLTWEAEADNGCLLYCSDSDAPSGDFTLLSEQKGTRLDLSLGEDGIMPIPAFGQKYDFCAWAYRETETYLYRGLVSESVRVRREDFLPKQLDLKAENLGNNTYALRWNETPGDSYRLEMRRGGLWKTLCSFEQGQELRYTTENLPAYGNFEFRLSVSGTELAEGEYYPVDPETLTVRTEESVVFSTIWPLQALDIHARADMDSEVVGSAPGAKAYCVLAEENGMFRIRYDATHYGYIDARYCLINLPDYIGELCAYEITNSYESLYLVHEFEIPGVSGTVIKGYENVSLVGGEFLVPLLYPTAQKLAVAAKAARSEGYRLKIYDAYRPNIATVQIYNETEKILDDPIPEETFFRVKLVVPPEEETYADFMQNSVYGLGNFLARGASLHNIGIAVDLSMERLSDHQELEMQTRMHDLSLYSVRAANNANANLLSGFMTGAGLGILTSEWWHYQDNDARNSLRLVTQYAGVSAEGWKAGTLGWRYRRADGGYISAATATIDGVEYQFDAAGYVIS